MGEEYKSQLEIPRNIVTFVCEGQLEEAEKAAQDSALSLAELFGSFEGQGYTIQGIRKLLDRQDLENAKKLAKVCNMPHESLVRNLERKPVIAVQHAISGTVDKELFDYAKNDPTMDPYAMIEWFKEIGVPNELIEEGIAKSLSSASEKTFDRLIEIRKELVTKYNLSESAATDQPLPRGPQY